MSQSASTPLLSIEGLGKSYGGSAPALCGVDLELCPGELVALIGSSGAGKSTLLRCINRLVEPSSGSVRFDGRDMRALGGRELRQARRRMAMIFQGYNLVHRSTAIENVLQGRLGYKGSLAGALSLYSEDEKRMAFEALEQVGMAAFAYTRVDQLSGGQQQRVGIARALVQEPLLILADEPVASLDPRSSQVVMGHLRRAASELGIACLVSLHQVEYALEYADRVVCLSHGRICCQGRPAELSRETIASIYDEVNRDLEAEGGEGEGSEGAPAAACACEAACSCNPAAAEDPRA